MAQERPDGPAALLLTATVARRHYLDGASKRDIADELGLSRFKVARLLEQARASGMVRIELAYPAGLDVELALRLRAAYGLRHCVVVDDVEDSDDAIRAVLGRAAADLLAEIIGPEDVLGLVWGRSLLAMREALTELPACTVVQLTGALSRPDVDASSVELVRDVARLAGGPAHWFYAPLIVPDAATARALRTQPEIAAALAMASRVTKAVVGVGAWAPGQSTVADAVPEADRREAYARGVRAETGGVLLDADGRAVATSLTDRLISIDADRLQAIDDVIGIVYGAAKAPAVGAAVRGGFVTSLVTHGAMARALLAS
ncbi:MAG TPA: sugar-binding domain-containing protein [Solirubrobacteraceae bacterium]|jgi:DNA-binding transcriptional regulator LsrR (DeoR family)